MSVLTKGPRPPQATPWSKGELFPGPDQCGAFEVDSLSMGKNARGQIIAVARLFPRGVGRIIAAAGKQTLFKIRRELTAHDYIDGAPHKHKKSFGVWLDDTLLTMVCRTASFQPAERIPRRVRSRCGLGGGSLPVAVYCSTERRADPGN